MFGAYGLPVRFEMRRYSSGSRSLPFSVLQSLLMIGLYGPTIGMMRHLPPLP